MKFAAFAAALVVASPALAGSADDATVEAPVVVETPASSSSALYGVIFGGLNMSTGNDGFGNIDDMPANDNATGGNIGVGLGYIINDNFRVEGRLNYRQSEEENTATGYSAGLATNIEATFTDEFESTEIAFDLIYDFSSNGALKPYLKAGIGYAKTSYSANLASAAFTTGFGLDSFDYAENTEEGVTWNVGIGATYALGDQTSLFAEYQYTNLGEVKTGTDIFNTGDYYGSDDYGVHEINVGLNFNF